MAKAKTTQAQVKNVQTLDAVIAETKTAKKSTKPAVKKQPVSRFAKFNHLASVLKIENTEAIKNYMLFALASRKTRTKFDEFALETLYKYSMDSEFRNKVDSFI